MKRFCIVAIIPAAIAFGVFPIAWAQDAKKPPEQADIKALVPKVELLPEYLPSGEKLPKGIPVVPAKGNIHIAYKCRSVVALKEANLRYRVIPMGHDLKAKPIPWAYSTSRKDRRGA